MQTSASEPVQGNGKSTGYKAPVQGHFYQVVGQDGKAMIFATKRITSTFLLSELLEKKAYGETWSLIHDGENVAFTAVEKMMDISSILTRLQTK